MHENSYEFFVWSRARVDFPTRDHEQQRLRSDDHPQTLEIRPPPYFSSFVLDPFPLDLVLARHLGRLHEEPDHEEAEQCRDASNDSKAYTALRSITREFHLFVAIRLVLLASRTPTGARVLKKSEEESSPVALPSRIRQVGRNPQ